MLKQGGIFLAAGDGRTSFISVVDIAEVAAVALVKGLASKEHNLTGPEALDHTAVAAIISKVAGRRSAMRSETFSFLCKDRPKLPWTALPSQLR